MHALSVETSYRPPLRTAAPSPGRNTAGKSASRRVCGDVIRPAAPHTRPPPLDPAVPWAQGRAAGAGSCLTIEGSTETLRVCASREMVGCLKLASASAPSGRIDDDPLRTAGALCCCFTGYTPGMLTGVDLPCPGGRAQRRQFVPFGRHGRLDKVSTGTAGQRHVDGTTRHETERTRRHRTRHHATERTTGNRTQAQRAQHHEPGTPIRTNSPQHGSETTQRNVTNTTAPRRRNAPRDTTATERQRQAAPRASGRRRRPRALMYAGDRMGSALVGRAGLSPAGARSSSRDPWSAIASRTSRAEMCLHGLSCS